MAARTKPTPEQLAAMDARVKAFEAAQKAALRPEVRQEGEADPPYVPPAPKRVRYREVGGEEREIVFDPFESDAYVVLEYSAPTPSAPLQKEKVVARVGAFSLASLMLEDVPPEAA